METFDASRHENPIPYSALPESVGKAIATGFSLDFYDEQMGKVKLMDADLYHREMKEAPAKVKQKIVKVSAEEPRETEEIELEV